MNEKGLESVRRNIKNRTAFANSVNPTERENEIGELVQMTQSHEGLKKLGREIILTELEKEKVRGYLKIAREKLLALGIEEAEELLPTLDQIAFIKQRKADKKSGLITYNREFLVIMLSPGRGIEDEYTQEVFFHELAHFATRFVLQKDMNGSIVENRFGFDREFVKPKEKRSNSSRRKTGTHKFTKGIYSEPLADLFMLYCADRPDKVFDSEYVYEDCFMIALLEEFSRRKGIGSFEAFKKMFAAGARIDFGFQKELVDVFGIEFVRNFNNLITESNFGANHQSSPEEYWELADLGEFFLDFSLLLRQITTGEGIRFSGLPGYLRKTPLGE